MKNLRMILTQFNKYISLMRIGKEMNNKLKAICVSKSLYMYVEETLST